MRKLTRVLMLFFIASMISSCSWCTEINPEKIPMYPNAHDINQEAPIIGGIDTYSWSFTTTDNPEKVWKFYEDKLLFMWSPFDSYQTFSQSNEKDMMIKGCQFYYFTMSSTPIDTTTYNIAIQFTSQYYY